MASLSTFLQNVTTHIIEPLLTLLFALALFAFVFGVGVFFDLKGDDPKERERGRRLLLWSIAGFFIMVSAVSLLAIVTRTFCGTALCK